MEISCQIFSLEKEKLNYYIEMHKNPWPGLVEATKKAGFIEQYCFLNDNTVTVISKAQNLKIANENLLKTKIYQKWTKTVKSMLSRNNNIDASTELIIDSKLIFNLSDY